VKINQYDGGVCQNHSITEMSIAVHNTNRSCVQELAQSQWLRNSATMGSPQKFMAWSIVALFIVSMEQKAETVAVEATAAPGAEVLAPKVITYSRRGRSLKNKLFNSEILISFRQWDHNGK